MLNGFYLKACIITLSLNYFGMKAIIQKAKTNIYILIYLHGFNYRHKTKWPAAKQTS